MLKKFIIIVFFLVLSIHFSGFAKINPQEELIGEHGDKYEFFSFQYLVRENLKQGKHPLAATDTMRYPVGFEFGHGYDGTLATFAGGLLGFVIPQILAYNVTIVLILFLNLSFAYLFLGTIQKSILARLVGSIIFGLSIYVLARINGHPNLLFVGGFPLLFYFVLQAYRKVKKGSTLNFWDFLSIGMGLLAVSFGSLQYIIMLAAISFLTLIASLVLNPRNFSMLFRFKLHFLKEIFQRLKFVAVFAAIVITVLLGSFYFGGYLGGIIGGSLVYGFDFAHYKECCIPSFIDTFIPNSYLSTFWGKFNTTPASIERVISLGMIEMALLLLVVFSVKRRISILLFGLFVLYVLLSINSIQLPFFPEGGRMVVLLSLLLATLIQHVPILKKNWVMFIMIILLLLERLPTRVHENRPLVEKNAVEVIRSSESKAVLNIPLSKYNPTRSFLPYLYGKKIVDGYFHDTAENTLASSFLEGEFMQRYICDVEKPKKDTLSYFPTHKRDTLKLLRDYDIRTVVVYKDPNYEKFLYDNCTNVRYWWYSVSPETIVFDSLSTGTKSVELKYYPRLITKFHFAYKGVFILDGLFISPNVFTDTKILRSDGKIIQIPGTYFSEGIRSRFIEPITLDVTSGDWIELNSEKPANNTIYITVYYTYIPDLQSPRKDPDISKKYTSPTIDVYELH